MLFSILFLHAKEVYSGFHMGGINNMQPVRGQTLGPDLVHHLIKQLLKAIRPQALTQPTEGGMIRGAMPRCSDPKTI